MSIKKLNKLFIGVITLTVFAYLLEVFDLSFFAGDLSQITANIQLVFNFIPDQSVQQINSILDILNNTTDVVKTLFITLTVLSAVASLICLFIVKLFADRIVKYKSFFSYSGLIIVATVTAYTQFKLMPTFTGLISFILILATCLIIVMMVTYIAIGTVGLYKLIMSEQFKSGQISFDIAKVLSFILVFYTGVIIATKVSLYISATVLVKEIDLAAMIDVMNYINIDWNQVLPPVVLSSGVITGDSINLVINNLADQYVLSYASSFVQNLILSLSRSLIFNNLIVYTVSLISGLGLLYTANVKFEYREYVAIGLMALAAILGFVYISSLIVNLIAIGLVACIGLMCLELYKTSK